MIELFIGDRKIDLTNDVNISFTYSSIDLDNPTADKNSFSKTVELKGTKNNNEIFGDAFELSRNIVEGGSIGAYFNPKKRVDFTLYNNGDIIESGYIKLDEVNIDNDEITYSVTLYGGLGDFFYNLIYNSDGDERSLADLHFGFSDVDDEDASLCLWDKDYIKASWEELESEDTNSIYDFLTAAPTYSGFYDDFDNEKMLIKYEDLPPTSQEENARGILENGVSGISGKTHNGWLLLEGQREMDEWEVQDLRSIYQRPCVKMSKVLDAISNPINNGGYEVVWDKDILDSTYYKDSWMVLNRIDFENDEASNSITKLELVDNLWQGQSIDIDVNEMGAETDTFDTSNWINPMINVSIIDMISLGNGVKRSKLYSENNNVYFYKLIGLWHYRVDIYVDGVYHSCSSDYFASTSKYTYKYKGYQYHFSLGNNGYTHQKVNIIPTSTEATNLHQFEKPIVIETTLPRAENVSFKVFKEYKVINVHTNEDWQNVIFDKSNGGNQLGFTCNSSLYDNDENELTVNGLYDGTVNPNVQKTRLTKKALFGSDNTPFDYLVGFTKMLGAKYMLELGEKKVSIKLRRNYFKDEIEHIDDDIDWGENIKLLPTSCEYKWYKYGLETPQTYASMIYNKKEKEDYGSVTIDSGYYFNNDKNELFEDICYTSAIPYKHSSIYFNEVGQIPPIFLTPYLELTYYAKNGTEFTEETKTIQGYSKYRKLQRIQDTTPKLCCFDKDNGNVDDITNCLVFLDGFDDRTIQLSDNNADLMEINENPCHVYCKSDITIATDVMRYPIFSKYITDDDGMYSDSLDFGKPSRTFIGNIDKYQDDITIYRRYWDEYITDIYDKNSRLVTLNVFMKHKPQVAMRKFYYFDKSIWVISEINDYDAQNDGTTEVKFLKVLDKDNYLS